MGFDVRQFLQTKWERRVEQYQVKDKDLATMFPKGEKRVWHIQSLTGIELGKASEVAKKQNISAAILEGLLSVRAAEIKDSVKSLLGHDEVAPEDIAKRVEHIKYGFIEPEGTLDFATTLCKAKPLVFLEVSNAISALTGLGMEPGKSKPSGKTPK